MIRSLSEIRIADTEAAVVPQEYTIRVIGAAAGELFTLFFLDGHACRNSGRIAVRGFLSDYPRRIPRLLSR